MNLAVIRGLTEGLGAEDAVTALEPAPGRCCVAIRHAGQRGGQGIS